MALFQTMAAGSGVLSPIFPDLKFRWSVDGLGEVYEDVPNGFLMVSNADIVARSVEYAPGQFSSVLPPHTSQLITPGVDTWTFKSFPDALAADWERDRHPVSIIDWPGHYNGFRFDLAYDTHHTGDSRRSVTWPPLRALFFSTDAALKTKAWDAMKSWCRDQLFRPLSHVSAPFIAPKNVKTCGGEWELNQPPSNPRFWGYNDTVTCPDQGGVNRQWNAFDPAHNQAGPQFALACADNRLGVVLVWMLFRWLVQGAPPPSPCSNSAYSVPFDQERSIKWSFDICFYAVMLGIEWADPNLIRDWCGGLDGKNNGAGFKPRESLRAYVDRFLGPEYGGSGANPPRAIYKLEANFPGDGHHQPYLGSTRNVCGNEGQCNPDFQFNGKSYKRLFGSEKGFHRYMAMWTIPEIIRGHDYLLLLDATDPLLDPGRMSEVRRFKTDFGSYVVEAGFLGSWAGSSYGRYRQRTHAFGTNCSEKGFESFAAIEAAIQEAIACNPTDCDGSGNPWVYPGTDASKRWHIFARQHTRFAPGAGLWYITAGMFSESEAKECGPPGYALLFGYDSDLQASIDFYGIQKGGSGYYSTPSTSAHFDAVWRAVEKANSSDRFVTGPALTSFTPSTSIPFFIPPSGPSTRFVFSPVIHLQTAGTNPFGSGSSNRSTTGPATLRLIASSSSSSPGGGPPPPPFVPGTFVPLKRAPPKVYDLAVDVGDEGQGLDLVLADGDVKLDGGLRSAALISLFSDARRPANVKADRNSDPRGWWPDTEADRFGSLLWMLDPGKRNLRSLEDARQWAQRSLAWMVTRRIAQSVEVSAVPLGTHGGVITVKVTRRRGVTYDALWESERLGEFELSGFRFRLLSR